jgi:hypothetical protein
MVNQVFANGLEVACKVAEGVSSAAFPDPCWSPPYPKAGRVLIPYANTSFANTLENGSKSVFITGKPVALKDFSFFGSSSGNEAATRNLGMGLLSGVIQGKAYFKSWSMNVSVEGYNVCRHSDRMTHNHGSDPGNTGNWTYIDTADRKKACKEERKAVEKHCGVSESENKKFKNRQAKRKSRKKKTGGVLKKHEDTSRDMTWKDKNCIALMIKPSDIDTMGERLQQLEDEANDLVSDIFGTLGTYVGDKASDLAARAGSKWLAGLGCTVVGPEGTVVCEAGVTVWNIGDSIFTGLSTLWGLGSHAFEVYDLKDVLETGRNYYENLQKYQNCEITKSEFWDKIRESMKEYIEDNKCLRSRKCMLSPWKTAQTANKYGKEENTTVNDNSTHKTMFDALGSKGGCCPGQTGHHLIPDAWMKNCPQYNEKVHRSAPVVCAEGTSHSDGTHGTFHEVTDIAVQDLLGESISMNDAIDLAVEIHNKGLIQDFGPHTFFGVKMGNHCNPECIEAQLRSFYDKIDCDPEPTLRDGSKEVKVDKGTKGKKDTKHDSCHDKESSSGNDNIEE